MVQQTIQFESVSLSEIGSGTITAFLFSGATLSATLASITENGTLKGRYTGTVDDIAAAEYRLVVKFNGYTVNEPDEVVPLLLAVGTYVAERHAVLNTAEREAIASTIYDTLTTHPVLEDSYGELFQNIAAIGAATQTKASNILDGVGWLLADATGAIAAPQSATATAILTTFGSTYTVQYAGLTSTGVRTAPTLSKA